MDDSGGVQDNWDFWVTHYSDPLLRANTGDSDEPTLSQMLSREKLRKTRIQIENLPVCCTEEELKNYLEGELGRASVLKTAIQSRNFEGRAIAEFYQAATAEKALNVFNGQKFRNHQLRISFWEENCPEEQEQMILQSGTIEECSAELDKLRYSKPEFDRSRSHSRISSESDNCQSGSTEARKAGTDEDWDDGRVPSCEDDFLFSTRARPVSNAAIVPGLGIKLSIDDDSQTESNERNYRHSLSHEDFEKTLAQLLRKFNSVKYTDGRIRKLLEEQAAPSVQQTYSLWPLGAFRISSAIDLIGPIICLPESRTMVESQCYNMKFRNPWKESWEPFSPQEICQTSEFVNYLEAFLNHFGPVWIWDGLFLLFLKSLPAYWPRNPQKLLDMINPEMPFLLSINDTLFNVKNAKHRKAATDTMRAGTN